MKLGVVVTDGHPKWQHFVDPICRGSFRQDEDAEIVYFHAWRQEYPTLHNTAGLDALICLGSRHSVNDNTPWMRTLEKFLLSVADTDLKVIGICFSHQLINKAYGGKVSKVPTGFIFGANMVHFKKAVDLPKSVRDIVKKSSCCAETLKLHLLESHGQEVSQLPPGSVLLASSERCRNEVVLVRDNVMTMQGHPELSYYLMMGNIWPAITAKGYVDPANKETVEKEMRNLDSLKCLELIRDFITS